MRNFILLFLLLPPILSVSNIKIATVDLSGMILESTTIEPIAKVHVWVLLEGEVIEQVWSDLDGTFTVKVPIHELVDIKFDQELYQSQIHKNIWLDPQTVYGPITLLMDIVTESSLEELCHAPCTCYMVDEEIEGPANSEIRGKLVDKTNGEPLPFVNIVIEKDGIVRSVGQTNFDGNYFIKPIPEGTYTLKATSVGFKPLIIKDIIIEYGVIKMLDITMDNSGYSNMRCCYIVYCYAGYGYREPEPSLDLFVEQDSINDSIDSVLPSFGFNPNPSATEFTLYPNPANSQVNLTNIPAGEELEVIDAQGQLIEKLSIMNLSKATLDVSTYASGMYYIKYFENGLPKTLPLIKK